MTEADVVGFAALTGDWTAIHTDAVYAAGHPFGQRVAHGLLGLSIASALAARLGHLPLAEELITGGVPIVDINRRTAAAADVPIWRRRVGVMPASWHWRSVKYLIWSRRRWARISAET